MIQPPYSTSVSKTIGTTRYKNTNLKKSTGATYTPSHLAEFIAKKLLQFFDIPKNGEIKILDPACGDGELLVGLIKQIPHDIRERISVFGYDTDGNAIETALKRLKDNYPCLLSFNIEKKDFLELFIEQQSGHANGLLYENFHLIIANPPYVRTQTIGSEKSKELARVFGLSGNFDFYYPFLLCVSKILREDGVAGVITSNRFMTTKSGKSLRRALLSNFNILHLFDMGDTKLFDAAVLPSILFAHGIGNKEDGSELKQDFLYSSIYETKGDASIRKKDVIDALTASDNTIVSVLDGRNFLVRHGSLGRISNTNDVWRLSTKMIDKWLITVEKNTWNTFDRIGKVRVGVKSAADKIFIRNDWNEIATGRPELLKPLITRKHAQSFKASIPHNIKHIKEILYPHKTANNKTISVDLSLYPNSYAYLQNHRTKLESRQYLINSGRKWYEIWVPQKPNLWSAPKIVFTDISEKPTFWLDTDGGVVSGECYWLMCDKEEENELLWLALAVANSTFIEKYYDYKFNNKLYSGKRRFITQYVQSFPLPDPLNHISLNMVYLVKEIYFGLPTTKDAHLIKKLDNLVWKAFGVL